jgi:hypothetical protein
MYAQSHERVCYPDNDAGIWLPSRCLAMDARSESDIPAFRRYSTIIYKWRLFIYKSLHSLDKLGMILRNRIAVMNLVCFTGRAHCKIAYTGNIVFQMCRPLAERNWHFAAAYFGPSDDNPSYSLRSFSETYRRTLGVWTAKILLLA